MPKTDAVLERGFVSKYCLKSETRLVMKETLDAVCSLNFDACQASFPPNRPPPRTHKKEKSKPMCAASSSYICTYQLS